MTGTARHWLMATNQRIFLSICLLLAISPLNGGALSENLNSSSFTWSYTELDALVRQGVEQGHGISWLTACELAIADGYPCKEVDVLTEDGFIVKVYRLPSSRLKGDASHTDKQSAVTATVVLHGFMGAASSWLANGDGRSEAGSSKSPAGSLPYFLWEAGHDVWILNARGRPPMKHVTLKPEDDAFWRWSWDEIALQDLKCTLQKAKQMFGRPPRIVAHSQGTLATMALLSHKQLDLEMHAGEPKQQILVSDLVERAVLLCPVAFLNSKLDSLLPALHKVVSFACRIGRPCEAPVFEAVRSALAVVNRADPKVTTKMLCSAGCSSPSDFNQTAITRLTHSFPGGTSMQNLFHFEQLIKSGPNMRTSKGPMAYDFGTAYDNLKHYDMSNPPTYSLHDIQTPLGIVHGGADTMATVPNVKRILELLPRQPDLGLKFLETYGHQEFVYGLGARETVFPVVQEMLEASLP